MAKIIDGKAIAACIQDEIKTQVADLTATGHRPPGLAVVLVGARKDSQTYVRMKKKACADAGIVSFGYDLTEDAPEAELLALIDQLNQNPDINGILVQLPLPSHMNEERVLDHISIEKDVDGLHPLNVGRLAMKGRVPLFVPCTPRGCIELLLRSGIAIEGKEAVVIGRSNIVGVPAALLLQERNATVTVAHSRTPHIAEVVRRADIVIAAIGKANFVKGDWIKPGAAVIDVGINAVDDPSDKRGYKLVGDVDFDSCREVAGAITPVPGGVGPMTIAMLLQNTVESRKRQINTGI
eukprot:GILK01000930.1.p1 GENE.GILK01000930.1~~GILK01000930.1.p1  ORF type:complete len:295 (-),score=59.13 GILK01000930.1:122-1006(-)